MDWEIEREIAQLDVREEALDRPFATLSSGEKTKVLLAALFLQEDTFLLIDEPTNHLDAAARTMVGDYLRRKQGFLLVSHDRMLLDRCVDHILSINRTTIEVQKGNFSSWWENRRRKDQFEAAENEKLEKQIDHLTASSRRSAGWSDRVERTKYNTTNSGSSIDRGYVGHQAAKMMQRAKSIETRRQAAIEQKSALLHDLERSDSLKLSPLRYGRERLLECRDLALYYGERQVCGGICLEIRRGDRIAITGRNGCGKSSFLKLICGREISYSGLLRFGSGLKISYVSQDTSHLRGSLRDYVREKQIDESLFKAILRKLDFSREQFEKDMADYSGGQKKKVLIAASLCEQAHLYVWDEPLNFIDVLSRMQIEELIRSSSPTMVFVEHDRAFCENIATRKLALDK